MLHWLVPLCLALSGPAARGGAAPRRVGDEPRNVAIVLWNGVELLDFAGPGEAFSAARTAAGAPAFRVYTVAARKEPITSQGFVQITPQFDFEDCPAPDLVVLPGGGTQNARDVVPWLKRIEPDCELVMSVCTGAFLLGEAGLLDGLEATTWHGAIARLRKAYPRVEVHENRRFVDNGRVVTCAGVSAGIDGALHVVGRMVGEPSARAAARYMEYEGRPEPSPEPAPLAELAPLQSLDDAGAWVCPPCSEPCHSRHYDGPGNCPICGMELVLRSGVPTAVVLLYEGADFSETAALLGVLSASNRFLVHTVSDSKDEIRTLESLSVRPQFDFKDCPAPTLLVIPGGYGILNVASDDLFVEFVRAIAAKAETTLVTGTGAVLCAAAGLGAETTWVAPAWIARVAAEHDLDVTFTLEEDAVVDRRCHGKFWSARDAGAAARAALDAVAHFSDADQAARAAQRLGIEWQPR